MREPGGLFYLALVLAFIPWTAGAGWVAHSLPIAVNSVAILVCAVVHVLFVRWLIRLDSRNQGGPVPPIPTVVSIVVNAIIVAFVEFTLLLLALRGFV